MLLNSGLDLQAWVWGDPAACPICHVWLEEGGDCPHRHFQALGRPGTVTEAVEAIRGLREEQEEQGGVVV